VLALAFAAVLMVERRTRSATALYYWLAVIVLRTAATNIADLATLQVEVSYESVITGLAALLCGLVIVIRQRARATAPAARNDMSPGVPTTDALYWVAMLTAATMGTALGDYASHTITLRVASVISVGLLGAALLLVARARWQRASSDTARYWLAIVLARAAGTNIGDLIAFRKGLNLGLPASTLLTGLVFVAFVLLGSRRAAGSPAATTAGPAPSPGRP
jgi:uncharacterized membrane-anchored protein